jgi:hypothetical protein
LKQFLQGFPPYLLPRLAERLPAHVNIRFSRLLEKARECVLRAFLYHTQHEIQQFRKGHFPFPGEVLFTFLAPPLIT